MVSYHAHNGPVKFLTMATAVSNRPPESHAVATRSQEALDGEEACSPSGGLTAERGLWLGEAGGSVEASSSSSSCVSLALSQSSLEHRPEESAIYDLLNDPTHVQEHKRSHKVSISSVLVVSGGLGHRRVNRKTKQSRQEETVSTIMVWQIPLLSA